MILVTLADFATELMNFDETKVIVGRENADQETFSNDYIVIDNLAPATPQTHSRDYDYTNEKETLNTSLTGTFTFEFYGPTAETNAYKFLNLLSSQSSRDLQKAKGFTSYRPSSITNLKQQAGNKYFDRYEIEVLIQYNQSFEIDTLRIEKIPVSQTDDIGNSDSYTVEYNQ